ncbi:MAG: penicillin acylase family protein, partial [Kiloniellales bacterium]|nr:penicillin acylase family protein [Kiloniellales bacterium]
MLGSLPQIDGRIALPGLRAPVEVLRDADGVVTLKAQDMTDAARALGYVHAQDRLAQMEFMRRLGAGRLSEVMGESTVEIDRMMRTLGFYRLAEASQAHLDPETLASIEAYAAGVNAFLAEPPGPLPIEFQVLRAEPEPWRPADSLVWGRQMALQLSGNWSSEALRLRLAERLTREQIAFLWRPYPENAPNAIGDLAAVKDGQATHRAPPPVVPGDVLPWSWAPKDASNSWVVDGAHTATGSPILANDIHLALNQPGEWYLVRIETPELTLAGATAPGVPFLIAGHNGHIAWAFTTTHSDTQDLFLERSPDGAPARYETPDGPEPFEVREEIIEVRGGDPVTVTVRATRHGPVISDLRAGRFAQLAEDRILALAWPGLRADDRTADAIYAMNRARDWSQFRAALRQFHSPQQNLLYADRGGTIAFMAPPRVPLRPSGDGRVPVKGWTGAHDWTGVIPFDELPHSVDPARGRIVTANNKIVPADYPYLIAADWPSGHRAQRIEALLEGAEATTAAQHAAWQSDVVSLAAARLMPVLLETIEDESLSPRAEAAFALLSAWDFRMARDRPEPLIYYAWLKAANETLLADELGPEFPYFQKADADLLAAILTTGDDWCDNVETPPREACAAQTARALEQGLAKLADRFGEDMGGWRWGEAHQMRLRHAVLGRIPLIGDWTTRSIETDGGEDTVNRGGARLAGRGPRVFEHRHGATFRAVYDLSNLDQSLFMIATGQSGNPLSPFYGNLAERWRDGIYLKLDGEPQEIAGR